MQTTNLEKVANENAGIPQKIDQARALLLEAANAIRFGVPNGPEWEAYGALLSASSQADDAALWLEEQAEAAKTWKKANEEAWKKINEAEDAYWYKNGAGEIVSVPKD